MRVQSKNLNRAVRIVFLAAAFVSLASAGAQKAGTHPDALNLQSKGPTIQINRSTTSSGVSELDALAARLKRMVRFDSIGTYDGPQATVLGRIRDVDVDSLGRVFMLDNAFQMVRIFARNGDPAFNIGSEGSGPLDFRSPWSGWVEDDSTFAVVDAVLGTKYITSRDRARVSLQRVVPSTAAVTGGCGANGLLYTYMTTALPVGKAYPVIRVSDRAGRTIRSFGSAYDSESGLVRGVMSEGTVACMPDGASIHALSKLPFVRYFDRNGEEKWTARFDAFVIGHETYEPDSNGRWAIGIDPDRADHSYTRRITPIGNRFALVQVSSSNLKSMIDRREWMKLDTYVLDVASGKGLFVSDQLPILSAITGSRAYGFQNDPFPRILVFRVP